MPAAALRACTCGHDISHRMVRRKALSLADRGLQKSRTFLLFLGAKYGRVVQSIKSAMIGSCRVESATASTMELSHLGLRENHIESEVWSQAMTHLLRQPYHHTRRPHAILARQGFFEGIGGAIYNRGNIVVDGESDFSLNTASVSCCRCCCCSRGRRRLTGFDDIANTYPND